MGTWVTDVYGEQPEDKHLREAAQDLYRCVQLALALNRQGKPLDLKAIEQMQAAIAKAQGRK